MQIGGFTVDGIQKVVGLNCHQNGPNDGANIAIKCLDVGATFVWGFLLVWIAIYHCTATSLIFTWDGVINVNLGTKVLGLECTNLQLTHGIKQIQVTEYQNYESLKLMQAGLCFGFGMQKCQKCFWVNKVHLGLLQCCGKLCKG